MPTTTIDALGDSTTYGWNHGQQAAGNMVNTAQKLFGDKVQINNLGVSSTTLGDLLSTDSFKNVLTNGNPIAILNYGMNEAYRGESPDTFRANLMTAIKQLQDAGKKVILQTPNKPNSSTGWEGNVGDYARIISDVASQTNSTLDDKYATPISYASDDTIHPDEAGYGVLGQNLYSAINSVISSPSFQSTAATGARQEQSNTAAQNVNDQVGSVSERTGGLLSSAAAAAEPAAAAAAVEPAAAVAAAQNVNTSSQDVNDDPFARSAFDKYGVPVSRTQTGVDRAGNPVYSNQVAPTPAAQDASTFKEPSWVANARQTIGTGVVPVYPMRTVHGGNQAEDTSAAPIGYKYDNGQSQYVYLDLAGNPTGKVENRGSGIFSQVADMAKTVAPLALAALGANYLPGLLGGADVGIGSSLTPAAIESGLGTAGYGLNASALNSGLFNAATVGSGALTAADLAASASLDTAAANALTTALETITPAATALTPAALESLAGTAGYGTNASAIQAALAAGIDPAIVGSGALAGAGAGGLLTGGAASSLTPAAIDSGLGTPGYGVNASALNAVDAAGNALFNPATVGAGALGTLGGTSLLSSITGGLSSLVSSAIPALTTGGLGSLVTAALPTIAGVMTGNSAKDAAQIQADAIKEAAKTAADAAKFKPVGVTTAFGKSNFGYDANGNLISAGYELTPELAAQRDAILKAAGTTGMDWMKNTQTAGQGLFNLGQGYVAKTPEQAAAEWMAAQQKVLQPAQDTAYARMQQNLANTGRGGLSIAQGTGMGAANPEAQAYYNALMQQNNELAAAGQAEGRAATTFGQGLMTGGLDLVSAGYNPYKTGFGTAQSVEEAGKGALDISSSLAGRTSAAGANAGNTLYQGAVAASGPTAKANAYNPYADLLAGAAGNPTITDYLNKWISGV